MIPKERILLNKKKALYRLFGMIFSTIMFAIGIAFMMSVILNEEVILSSYVFWIGLIISIVFSAMMWKNLKKD